MKENVGDLTMKELQRRRQRELFGIGSTKMIVLLPPSLARSALLDSQQSTLAAMILAISSIGIQIAVHVKNNNSKYRKKYNMRYEILIQNFSLGFGSFFADLPPT
jgi:hypothetical protein